MKKIESGVFLLIVGLLVVCAVRADEPAQSPSGHDRRLPLPARPPQSLKMVHPVYPIQMRIAGLEAKVTVEFIVDTNGNVASPYVVRSNNPAFERPALDAVLKWKFKPATLADGRPVHTRVQQEITFNLHGGGKDLWEVSKPKNHATMPPEFQWDESPQPVHTNYPVYPFEALREKRSGKATIRFVADPSGRVAHIDVVESTAPEFAGAAVAAIDAWRFKPAKRKGEPCFAVLQLSWEFDPAERNAKAVPIPESARDILREITKTESKVAKANELDQPVRAISRRPPIYPTGLQAAGEEGMAEIQFYIDKAGDAQLPHVISATKPEFGYAAVQSIATWRYHPPIKNGRPVETVARIAVKFSPAPETPEAAAPAPTSPSP